MCPCVAGAGGFIASHLAKRLKSEGHYIVACDWKRNEHMPEEMFCDEFHLVDLRVYENCKKVRRNPQRLGPDWVVKQTVGRLPVTCLSSTVPVVAYKPQGAAAAQSAAADHLVVLEGCGCGLPCAVDTCCSGSWLRERTSLPIPHLQVVKDCEHVFNLAADMGGMGFIQSNHSVIMYNNTMISFHMLEVSRILGIKRSASGEFPWASQTVPSRVSEFLLRAGCSGCTALLQGDARLHHGAKQSRTQCCQAAGASLTRLAPSP